MSVRGSIKSGNCGQPRPIRLVVEHHQQQCPEGPVEPVQQAFEREKDLDCHRH